jgi:hypothetical protein
VLIAHSLTFCARASSAICTCPLSAEMYLYKTVLCYKKRFCSLCSNIEHNKRSGRCKFVAIELVCTHEQCIGLLRKKETNEHTSPPQQSQYVCWLESASVAYWAASFLLWLQMCSFLLIYISSQESACCWVHLYKTPCHAQFVPLNFGSTAKLVLAVVWK